MSILGRQFNLGIFQGVQKKTTVFFLLGTTGSCL
jgi:hypothetical protein